METGTIYDYTIKIYMYVFDIWTELFLNLKWTGIDAYNQMKCISVKKIDSKKQQQQKQIINKWENYQEIVRFFVIVVYDWTRVAPLCQDNDAWTFVLQSFNSAQIVWNFWFVSIFYIFSISSFHRFLWDLLKAHFESPANFFEFYKIHLPS